MVKSFFQMIEKYFPTEAEILFDYIHPILVGLANKSNYIQKNSAQFKWGIRSIQNVIAWSDRFRLLNEVSIMSQIGGTRAWVAKLFHWLTKSHLYAIAQLKIEATKTP